MRVEQLLIKQQQFCIQHIFVYPDDVHTQYSVFATNDFSRTLVYCRCIFSLSLMQVCVAFNWLDLGISIETETETAFACWMQYKCKKNKQLTIEYKFRLLFWQMHTDYTLWAHSIYIERNLHNAQCTNQYTFYSRQLCLQSIRYACRRPLPQCLCLKL